MQKSVLVAYVPVLHEGYRRFFEAHASKGACELYLFGPDIISHYRPLTKEIRQLDPLLMKGAVESLGLFDTVLLLDEDAARELNSKDISVILPDEVVSREVASEYFQDAETTFDSIFLRWDKHNALAERPVVPDEYVTRSQLHRKMLGIAEEESKKSSDMWRHVGGVIAKDGEVLLVGHNTHVPSEHMPYVNGDPRSNFKRGLHIEISTALHAEAGLIAEAARQGIPLEGTEMYLTVFPCPPCAKLIAYAGIKNLYCGGGYSVLDGEQVLKAKGVKIYFVE